MSSCFSFVAITVYTWFLLLFVIFDTVSDLVELIDLLEDKGLPLAGFIVIIWWILPLFLFSILFSSCFNGFALLFVLFIPEIIWSCLELVYVNVLYDLLSSLSTSWFEGSFFIFDLLLIYELEFTLIFLLLFWFEEDASNLYILLFK